MEEAESRLGFRMQLLESQAISVAAMLGNAKHRLEDGHGDAILIESTKEKVYDRIVDHIEGEGYPTESDRNFKEVNINDLVYTMIIPIIANFRRQGHHNVHLLREKQIISTDSEVGSYEEFVVVDEITVTKERFVLIVEAKRSSLGDAMKQCLLSIKDMWDSNGGGEVYGFVTTGDLWKMITYDGGVFRMTWPFFAMFPGMGKEKELWMKDYSILVDCIFVALNNGGMVKQDVVV